MEDFEIGEEPAVPNPPLVPRPVPVRAPVNYSGLSDGTIAFELLRREGWSIGALRDLVKQFGSGPNIARRLHAAADLFANMREIQAPTDSELSIARNVGFEELAERRQLIEAPTHIVTQWNAVTELIGCPYLTHKSTTPDGTSYTVAVGEVQATVDAKNPESALAAWSALMSNIVVMARGSKYEMLMETEGERQLASTLVTLSETRVQDGRILCIVGSRPDSPLFVRNATLDALVDRMVSLCVDVSRKIDQRPNKYHDKLNVAGVLLCAVHDMVARDRPLLEEYLRIRDDFNAYFVSQATLPYKEKVLDLVPVTATNVGLEDYRKSVPSGRGVDQIVGDAEAKIAQWFSQLRNPTAREHADDLLNGGGAFRFTGNAWGDLGRVYWAVYLARSQPLINHWIYSGAGAPVVAWVMVKYFTDLVSDATLRPKVTLLAKGGGFEGAERVSPDKVDTITSGVLVMFSNENMVTGAEHIDLEGDVGMSKALEALVKLQSVKDKGLGFCIHGGVCGGDTFKKMKATASAANYVFEMVPHFRGHNRDMLYFFRPKITADAKWEINVNIDYLHCARRVHFNQMTRAYYAIFGGEADSLLDKKINLDIAVALLFRLKKREASTPKRARLVDKTIEDLVLESVAPTAPQPMDQTGGGNNNNTPVNPLKRNIEDPI